MVETTTRNATDTKKTVNYQVIDNFLDDDSFKVLIDNVMSSKHIWYYGESVADESKIESDMYFMNLYYMDAPDQLKNKLDQDTQNTLPIKSDNFSVVKPIIDRIDHNFLLRAKANLYTRTDKIIHHPDHQDYDFTHMGAIFYVNTNDGLTVLDNEVEIDSVSNRLLVFDGSTMHHSTTCTNQKRRVNINFNFM
tara:strand:- start:732 stop:1310 length:579 start_codon:yes stop_codon:yes gene_type:complete